MKEYVVTTGRGLAVGLLPTLLTAVAVVVFLGVIRDSWIIAVIAALVSVAFGIPEARSGWRRLVVDETGVSLAFPREPGRRGRGRTGVSRRSSQWTSVRRLVVVPASSAEASSAEPGPALLRVVLRPDAPLPPWVRARVIDPNDPEGGVSYEREVPGLDPVALESAVRSFAPYVEVQMS